MTATIIMSMSMLKMIVGENNDTVATGTLHVSDRSLLIMIMMTPYVLAP